MIRGNNCDSKDSVIDNLRESGFLLHLTTSKLTLMVLEIEEGEHPKIG